MYVRILAPPWDGFCRRRTYGGCMVNAELVVTRRASEQDVDTLVLLRTEMFRAMGTPSLDGSWAEGARLWFLERIHTSEYGIFVAELDGRVVACSVAAVRDAAPSPSNPCGRDVLISNVCTFPAQRGRGYGQRVFEAALAWARGTGIRRAELMSTAAGRGMYERAGFVETTFPAMRADI
ncbi:hypothetical protein KVA01_03210 [Kocuria varians]|uniref:N-acetyltransferase domain-containing protein n=2 Tax=Kocuria varians TaxID=1272 RepID=A0A4Y4D0Q3_KOCVA|nr:hypothetical protein KVA01_03210 [Kocuria varians]